MPKSKQDELLALFIDAGQAATAARRFTSSLAAAAALRVIGVGNKKDYRFSKFEQKVRELVESMVWNIDDLSNEDAKEYLRQRWASFVAENPKLKR